MSAPADKLPERTRARRAEMRKLAERLLELVVEDESEDPVVEPESVPGPTREARARVDRIKRKKGMFRGA